jgi:hypothetical protein
LTERYADGRCKPCRRDGERRYAEQNPEKARERRRRYRQRNPEKVREQVHRWREQNPEKRREQNRRYYEQNPEKVREKHRRWREQNPEKARERTRRRRARKHAALIHDVTDQEVWEYNPSGPGCCNYCHTPLAFEDRKAWHIDHVHPLASFDLTKESERIKAFHYTNLRPLWARANLRTNDSITMGAHQPLLMMPPRRVLGNE